MADVGMAVDGVSAFNYFKLIHSQQLIQSGVPQIYWETLFYKLKNSIFDAGETFSLLNIQSEDSEKSKWKVIISTEDGIKLQDPKHIYLIDHAWTYRTTSARSQLSIIPGLLQRLIDLMEIDKNIDNEEELIEEVMKEMWKYNQTYHIANSDVDIENRLPVWYIMDEFGSRIQHSDDPSFSTVPFFYVDEQASYSILFPLKSSEIEDEVTRDYVQGTATDSLQRQILKIPWFPADFSHISVQQSDFESVFEKLSLASREVLPEASHEIKIPTDRKLRVYSQYKLVIQYLTDPQFEIADDENSADILWYLFHYRDFKALSEQSPNKFINQFPFENLLTVKDLLLVIAKSSVNGKFFDETTLQTFPRWLPTTFDLQTELPQFVSYFQQREQKKMDNTWICKPWNLARSLDIHITKNLNYILRLPFSGPKIACKYIEDAVLYYREDIAASVKFDIRYVVLLKSVHPLKLYVYDKFWLRFANKSFSLDHFDDYAKHFTVMNYINDTLHQVKCDDFLVEFTHQYPNLDYQSVQTNIHSLLKEIFVAATSKPPPKGIGHNLQSRAMFAADLMLEWDENHTTMNPKLLEINWMPDCERACDYYPNFYNDVFSVLFLDDIIGKNVKEL